MNQNCLKSPKMAKNHQKCIKVKFSIFTNFHPIFTHFRPFSPIFTHFHPFSPIFTKFPPIFTNFRPSISSLVYHEIKTHEICRRNDIFKKSHFFQAPIFSNFLQFFPIFSNFHQFFPIFSNFSQFSPIFSNLDTFNFSHVAAHICVYTRSARRNACKQICLFRPTPIFTNFHQFCPIFINFGQFLKGANHFHQFVKGVD